MQSLLDNRQIISLIIISGQQYEELMKKYNQIKIDIKNANEKKSKMAEIDAEIQRINEEIKLAKIKADTADFDANESDERIRELQRLIEEEDNKHKLIEARNRVEIASLEEELTSKNQLLSSAHHGSNVDESTISTSILSTQQVIDLQKQLEQLQNEVDSLQAENQNLQQQYQELQSQTKQKEIQYNNAVESGLQNEQTQREKTAQIENLQKQLKLLNEQFEILKNILETEQLKHSLKAQENRRKNEDYNRQLEDLEQLRDKLKREIQIKQKERALQRDKLINENNKLSQQKQTITNMDKQYNLLEKHSVELDKNITELRKKIKDMKEQEKPQKPKKTETNFKLEMNSLETKIKTLEEEIERERKKYNEIVKMKSTYVSQSELAKLQDEYNKLIVNAKPVEGELKKNQRLKQDNKLLKQRVEYLKKADEQSIRDKKNLISQIKAKNQNLIEHKQFYEKQIQHNQAKLNEYMKEYPNHEHEKEERKKAKKHHKQQQSQEDKLTSAVSVEESKPAQVGEGEEVKTKKRRVRNRGKELTEEREDEIVFDENAIPQTTDKMSEIYKNKNVQLAILGAVVILGLLLFLSLN